MKIEVLNTEAICQRLREIGASASDINAGLHKAGLVVAAAAKANAPVKTTHLMESITARPGNGYCDVGTNVEYAMYQEFGTYKMAAHPFLIPGLEQSAAEVKSVIKAEAAAKL